MRIRIILIRIAALFFALYFISCVVLYFRQEKFIFRPTVLGREHQFRFDAIKFEERNTITEDGTELNGLLFKADSSKGLIFYMHGNAGSLERWGRVARNYTRFGYDFFIFDYRGFGKSTGIIFSEEQFYDDVRSVYNNLRKDYDNDEIVVIGYSIGTGPATMLASENQPKMLVLLAPYYSLTDMMEQLFPLTPTFLLDYKFSTNEFIQKVKSPVVIFHGNEDKLIKPDASLRLKELMKPDDKVFILKGQPHNRMDYNEQYLSMLGEVLRSSADTLPISAESSLLQNSR